MTPHVKFSEKVRQIIRYGEQAEKLASYPEETCPECGQLICNRLSDEGE